MNETYQHPGKWHEFHIKPTTIRTDSTHYIMSYVVKNLEHNAVYEAIVQARNKYGWNEVRPKSSLNNNKLHYNHSILQSMMVLPKDFLTHRMFILLSV